MNTFAKLISRRAAVWASAGILSLLGGGVMSAAEPALATPPKKENFHIYLLMGQSNMVGRDTRALAAQVDNPNLLSLNADGQWVIARDPIHAQVGRIACGTGPGISFAGEMLKARPGVTIGLVPCAVGGTPLRRWSKGRGGDLYDNAVRRALIAAQAGTIKGVLWHQGEADTTKQENAESYESRLTKMIQDLRTDLGLPKLPFVVGQLGEFLAETPEKNPYSETVRTALAHLPSVVPGVGFAESAGLGHAGDKLHFSADAQKEFGVRYARAMQSLEK